MCEVIDSGKTQNSVEYFRSAFHGRESWITQKEITVDYSHQRRPTTGLATLRLKARSKTFTVQAREKV